MEQYEVDEIIPTALTLVPTGTETDPGEHLRNFAQTEPITVISAGEGFHAPVEVIRPRNSILADYVSYRDQTGPDPRTAALDVVADSLCRIIEVEGPMLAKRAYDIYLKFWRRCPLGNCELDKHRHSDRVVGISRCSTLTV